MFSQKNLYKNLSIPCVHKIKAFDRFCENTYVFLYLFSIKAQDLNVHQLLTELNSSPN